MYISIIILIIFCNSIFSYNTKLVNGRKLPLIFELFVNHKLYDPDELPSHDYMMFDIEYDGNDLIQYGNLNVTITEKYEHVLILITNETIFIDEDSSYDIEEEMDVFNIKFITIGQRHIKSISYTEDDCYHCLPDQLDVPTSYSTEFFSLSSTSSKMFSILIGNNTYQVHIQPTQYQLLTHVINIADNDTFTYYERDGESPYVSFFSILASAVVLFTIFRVFYYVHKRLSTDPEEYHPVDNTVKKSRINSIDVFRGVSIVIMIFANLGGGSYSFINHKVWNGLNIADFAFPWFVFISGASLVHSYFFIRKRMVDGQYLMQCLYKAVRRFLILLALGMFIVNHAYNLNEIRIPSVLGYFAIGGLINSLILLYVPYYDHSSKKITSKTQVHNKDNQLYDELWHSHIFEWVVMIIIPLIHFFISQFFKVPGCGAGYRGAGGIADYGNHMNCTGGAQGYIDKYLFGEDHMLPRNVYGDPQRFDPEGLLGSLNATFLLSLGCIFSHLFISIKTNKNKIITLLIYGIVILMTGYGLAEFKENGGFIPINKNLFSLSFILVTAGYGYIVVVVLFMLVDIGGYWTGYPFIQSGKNPIFMYMVHEVLGGYFPFSYTIETVSHFTLMLRTTIGTCLFVLVGLYCDFIGFYVKV